MAQKQQHVLNDIYTLTVGAGPVWLIVFLTNYLVNGLMAISAQQSINLILTVWSGFAHLPMSHKKTLGWYRLKTAAFIQHYIPTSFAFLSKVIEILPTHFHSHNLNVFCLIRMVPDLSSYFSLCFVSFEPMRDKTSYSKTSKFRNSIFSKHSLIRNQFGTRSFRRKASVHGLFSTLHHNIHVCFRCGLNL